MNANSLKTNNIVIKEVRSIGCHLFFCKQNFLQFVQPRWHSVPRNYSEWTAGARRSIRSATRPCLLNWLSWTYLMRCITGWLTVSPATSTSHNTEVPQQRCSPSMPVSCRDRASDRRHNFMLSTRPTFEQPLPAIGSPSMLTTHTWLYQPATSNLVPVS